MDDIGFWRGYLPYLVDLGASEWAPGYEMIKIDPESQDYVETYNYADLMTMMWHQLKKSVLSRVVFKRCARPECGKIFEPRTRSHQKYCNDTFNDGKSRCKSLVASKKAYIPNGADRITRKRRISRS